MEVENTEAKSQLASRLKKKSKKIRKNA